MLPHESWAERVSPSRPFLFVPLMCMGPSPSKSDNDYRAEDDHRTLMRAAEIKGDKSRLAGVKRHHAKTRASLSKVGRTLGGRR